MHILVTNDDGIRAPGLLALAQRLRSLGDISVVAPDRNWSASGHVKTMHRPLRVQHTELADGTPAVSSDGAPSDCVALALLGLVEAPIDLLVSGINPTANVGHDLTYSGTVTAAMEGAIAGVPSMAISLDTPDDFEGPLDFEPASQVALQLASKLMSTEPPEKMLINVNVPFGPAAANAPWSMTRQGLRIYRDQLVKRRDPRGRPYYWIGGDPPSGVLEAGTDFWALDQGLVSITPLKLDFTDYGSTDTFQSLLLGS
ncbi:MAG: 5'/3'-nucleotidase SurE [Anaerolineales bacterium]